MENRNKAEDQKRIMPDQVVEAYQKTEYAPASNLYISLSNKCACAIGAVFTYENDPKEKNELQIAVDAHDWSMQLLGGEYHMGFTRGFDNDSLNVSLLTSEKEEDQMFLLGFEDGQNARKAVIKAELAEEGF